jgi:hypothetical protein
MLSEYSVVSPGSVTEPAVSEPVASGVGVRAATVSVPRSTVIEFEPDVLASVASPPVAVASMNARPVI